MEESPPLVFVYSGNPIPRYAVNSLRLAAKRFSGPIFLISDYPLPIRLPGVKRLDPEDWYDPSDFQLFSETSPLDPLYRGGFWLRAAERFFILSQYMVRFDIPKLFHAELDVLVLDLVGYHTVLDSHGKGIFAPMEAPGRALASLMYVNDVQALEDLVSYTKEHVALGNEMEILGHFIDQRPDQGHALPSDQVFDVAHWPYSRSSVPAKFGLIDAVVLGYWLLGQDPRNSERSMWNHYRTRFVRYAIETLRFRASFRGNQLTVRSKGNTKSIIRTIHVHSKVFGRLRVPGVLALYAWSANLPWRTLIAPKKNGWIGSIVSLTLSRGSAKILSALPRGTQKALATLLIPAVDRSPRLLSERQRRVINSLLPSFLPASSDDPNIFPVVRTPSQFCPTSISELIDYFPQDLRNEARDAAGVFWHAMSVAQEPTCYVLSGEAPRIARHSSAGRWNKIPLFPSNEKHYDSIRHTVDHWSESRLSRSWSFASRYQVIEPTWVKEMFPDGQSDLRHWLLTAHKSGSVRPNALQAYGIWVWNKKKGDVNLCRADDKRLGS